MQGLLVGARAGRRSAERALARDDDIDAAAFQLHGGAQPCGPAAEDKGFGSGAPAGEASDLHEFLGGLLVGEPRHGDVGQAVENRLGNGRAQARFPELGLTRQRNRIAKN